MNLLGGLVAALASAAVVGTPVFTFSDDDITESSGLVDLGSTMVTMNDSGGDAVVYVVDGDGDTIGRTTYADEVEDVEALAPAGRSAVWVGDIGDNQALRPTVRVYRVPVGRGDRTVDATSYELDYPDGSHDAESLLSGRDGRLRIVTKGITGGQVYVAPKVLDPNGPNRLERGPEVALWATDAALFADGRHVIVRGYGSALVATFPAFEQVGYFDLPDQEQGEGISVGPADRIRISTEGSNTQLLAIRLPASLTTRLAGPPAAPEVEQADRRSQALGDSFGWPWVLGGLLGLGALGWFLTRRQAAD